MTRSFISSEMLAVIEKAREIVDCETPRVRATSWAVTWALIFWAPVLGIARLAIGLWVSQEACVVRFDTIGCGGPVRLLKTLAIETCIRMQFDLAPASTLVSTSEVKGVAGQKAARDGSDIG